MDWIKINFDDSEENLMRIIPELPELDAESLDLLWSIIFKHTVHGRTREAAKLLEFTNQEHSTVFAEQLALMAELMKNKPQYQPNKTAMSDFSTAWQAWKDECENRLQSFAFLGSDQLILLAKVNFVFTYWISTLKFSQWTVS